jgi:hypothetical protein
MQIAAGKTCDNCSTLTTCVGDDASPVLYGKCPCCGAVTSYVLDPVAQAKDAAEAEAAQREINIAKNAAAEAAAPPVPEAEAPSASVQT